MNYCDAFRTVLIHFFGVCLERDVRKSLTLNLNAPSFNTNSMVKNTVKITFKTSRNCV